MDEKLKIFGIVACVIIAMSLGIIWELFLEKFKEEKIRYEFLDLKNKMLLLRGVEILECKNYSGGGVYKINENGSITFIKSAEKVDGPQGKKLCNKHKNCSMIKVTVNDSLPIVVNKGDYGYGAMKKPKIFKNNSITNHFNETEIKWTPITEQHYQ